MKYVTHLFDFQLREIAYPQMKENVNSWLTQRLQCMSREVGWGETLDTTISTSKLHTFKMKENMVFYIIPTIRFVKHNITERSICTAELVRLEELMK